jgi:monoamine oxidase
LDFGGEALAYDRVVLTLPPPCLSSIYFEPALPEEKMAAIHACQMSRTIKISLVFRSRWWEEVGWSGFLFADSPLQQIWPALPPHPVLCAYIGGNDAVEWTENPEAVADAVAALDSLVPGAQAAFVRGEVHNWIADPFAQGGFTSLAPGYVLGHMQHIGSAVGRIHFGGEHTAIWTGFIEGALESAERVAGEIGQ